MSRKPNPPAKPGERQPLTEKQQNILRYMVHVWSETGRVPVIRTIGNAFGIASPNGVVCHLRALNVKGWIRFVASAAGDNRRLKTVRIEIPGLTDQARKLGDDYLAAHGLPATRPETVPAPTVAA